MKLITKEKIDNAIGFIYYLIQLIHYENNCPLVPNQDMVKLLNNIQPEQKMNEEYVRNYFSTLLQQTQNSIISLNFFNILRQEVICSNCPTKYYYFYKYMIKFYISDYIKFRNEYNPQKTTFGLTLDECFECYTGGFSYKCEACGNTKANVYSSFYAFPKVLLIGLIRKKHHYYCDVDFTNNLNVNNYCIQGINNNISTNYTLKACISLNSKGQCLSYINTNNLWVKYYGNQVSPLTDINTELKTFEPQILIYQINESNLNIINNPVSQMSQMQMNENFNMIGMNMNMNIMRLSQLINFNFQ